MHISAITLKQFRCFRSIELQLEAPIVIIQGDNGAGKTSVLEAFHYLCYLRSFRTHMPRELVHFGADHFFIKAWGMLDGHVHTMQAGFSNGQRRVRLDEKVVQSHKELLNRYCAITVTEDDLQLVKDGPEHRRTFIDTMLLLRDVAYAETVRNYKAIVEQRNSLLRSGITNGKSLHVWTERLFVSTQLIVAKRTEAIAMLSVIINKLLESHFDAQFKIILSYRSRHALDTYDTFETFHTQATEIYAKEARFARSCFGAHLDEIAIQFQDHACRTYASRGQQKLAVLLLKISVAQLSKSHVAPTLLLDDFITDFDLDRLQRVYNAIKTLAGSQIIFTTPLLSGPLQELAFKERPHQITLEKHNNVKIVFT